MEKFDAIDSEQEDLGQTFKSPEEEAKEENLYAERQSMDYKDVSRLEKPDDNIRYQDNMSLATPLPE